MLQIGTVFPACWGFKEYAAPACIPPELSLAYNGHTAKETSTLHVGVYSRYTAPACIPTE
jgi:hypothetical protein